MDLTAQPTLPPNLSIEILCVFWPRDPTEYSKIIQHHVVDKIKWLLPNITVAGALLQKLAANGIAGVSIAPDHSFIFLFVNINPEANSLYLPN